jgi:hypothetical protein
MSRLQMSKFHIDRKLVSQPTELTPLQKQVLRSLNAKEPSSVVDIQ